MTSNTVCGDAAKNFLSATPHSRVAIAALAGLAMLASPIQGANAAQAPPVREVDDPGRIPYQSSQTISAGQRAFLFPEVPAGHRLVIQHVSAHLNLQSAVTNRGGISERLR
jgi:hypothetical protein